MKKRIRKAVRKLRAGQYASALRALRTPHHTEVRIEDARREVSDFLRKRHKNTVAHGPFAAMKLPQSSYWGTLDMSSKILGTYERAVVDRLVEFSSDDGLLLDIGSADGYFAIGAMRADLFPTCICFERSEKGRGVLQDTAKINAVADRIRIYGTATEDEILKVVPAGQSGAVLCDIEGEEFRILTDRLLQHLSGMHILIELHAFLVDGGADLRRDLENRAAKFFDVEILRGATIDMSRYPDLDGFDDNHRLLAFSEGRDMAMEWMLLRPKQP